MDEDNRTKPDPQEAEIVALLLAPDAVRCGEGVVRVNAKYQLRIMARVRNRCPYLAAHDLPDIWQETLKELFCKASKGVLRTSGSLLALLTRIATNRAVDLYRQQTRGSIVQHSFTEALTAVLPGPATVAADTPMLESDLRRLLDEAIGRLSLQQQFVIREYFQEHPDSRSPTWLSNHLNTLSEGYSPDQTRMILRRALLVIRIHLEQRGYHFRA